MVTSRDHHHTIAPRTNWCRGYARQCGRVKGSRGGSRLELFAGSVSAQAHSIPPDRKPGLRNREEFRAWLRTNVTSLMDSLKLDALAYPTWSNPPRLIAPATERPQVWQLAIDMPFVREEFADVRHWRIPSANPEG